LASKRKNSEAKDLSKQDVEEKKVCPALGNTLMVDSNGEITVCCLDEEILNNIGNIDKIDLKEAINSPLIRRWINAQLKNNTPAMGPKCKDCTFYKEFIHKNQ